MMHAQEQFYEILKKDIRFIDFIQEHALDGLIVVNKNSFWINPKLYQTLGYKNNDTCLKPADLLITKDNQLSFDFTDLKNQNTADCNYSFKHKNGNTITLFTKIKTVTNETGDLVAFFIGLNQENNIQSYSSNALIKEQQLQLKKQELFLEKCNLAAKIGYWEVDLASQSLYWSDMTKVIHEANIDYEPKIATALNLYKEGESRDLITLSFHSITTKGTPFDHELQITTLQGNDRWVQSIGQAEFKDGACVRIYGTFQDITAKKESRLALIQEKEKLQSIIQATNAGTWEWNIQTGETQHSELWANIIGYTLDEIAPIDTEKWISLIHPDDIERSNKNMKACFEKQTEFYRSEYRIKHKDGSWIWVLDKGKIISWTDDDKPLMMFGTHVDISDNKKAALQLTETLNKIQGILDASTKVSIIETDLNGTITTFNKGAQNLLGYSKKEVLNKQTPFVFHQKDELLTRRQAIFDEFGENVDTFKILTYESNRGNYDTREWTYVKKNGLQFPVQLTITPVKTNKITTGYLGIAVDISNLKNAEKEIKSLLDVTKDQNSRLKNFAHIVSHNLRSHSGNIAMILDLLEYENPDLKENEFIKYLDQASANLKETIEHLNQVVLMNNSINENLQDLNLYDYWKKALKNLTVVTAQSNVAISCEIDPGITIKGIPAYLESILLNFITNGIKYRSEERQSYIKASCSIEDRYVVLHIKDNGIGIDMQKNRTKLFGMYKTFTNNPEARGIGLFITKNQVEALGGKIKVESELNKGTTFKIYLKK